MTTVPDLQETPLSRFCHLVENVLKFLPLKDVCRSTRVSKIWQSCAVKVLRGRMRVEHTVFRKLDPHRLLHLCEAPEVKDFLEVSTSHQFDLILTFLKRYFVPESLLEAPLGVCFR